MSMLLITSISNAQPSTNEPPNPDSLKYVGILVMLILLFVWVYKNKNVFSRGLR